ncbi:MAG: ABC transporter permease [Desulfosporosinus sp.]|jgi:ABC-2 type transport system permease protein
MMFAHIFIYRLKCLFRDRETIFWTALFPLLLATFFYVAFSNLNSGETFQAIKIAVVDDKQYQKNHHFKSLLNEVSKGDNRLFNLTIASKDQADQLLKTNSIAGYLIVESPIKLVVNKSGLNQNIIKSFIDNYEQTTAAVTSILTEDATKQQELIDNLGKREKYVKEVSGTSAEPNSILNYYYALIAMACFYGSLLGSREVTDIQADISPTAARINMGPVHKLKTFIYSSSASLLIHFAGLLVLLAYLYFALKVNFGSKTGYVLLTSFVGSVAGISFGTFISAIVKKSEGIKIAILIGSTMLCSFLAGMMYPSMKYIVAQKMPILSYLNPVNLLTDAFYCLYYFDTFSRYALNMGALFCFIIVFCSGTYFIIRRRRYASL